MEPEEDFDDLLLMLKETRGFDFTGYKRSTLHRRVRRRMTLLNIGAFSEYRDYLELKPDEFGLLFDSMLINVTSFFRDPLAWQALRERVIPELLSAKSAKAPIRAWSAGCATGEEAYTLAIVLAEALGPDQFRERVKIYATDLDEDALAQARTGSYEASALADIPERLRETYFEPSGTKHAFRRDLRRQVIFGRNDLTRDAPISRVDLLTARLQSTNEELETMNEELQSTNDELQVINEELRGRTEELDQTNGFLGTVLRSLGNAVIVLNEDLKVRVWSPGAEDLWGLRPEEAEDKELFSLDIGLPAVAVEPMLRRVLREAANDDTATALTGDVTAVNRRGKTVELQIVASPMRTEEGGISGVILVIDQRSP